MENKICIYAICKNEIKFVDQWLDNMSEADYIVVLDTGSTDGTYEKLKQDKRVTKVIKKEIKPWRFDVARNESMKLVPDDANILLCTDFDETFEPGWGKLIRDNWTTQTTRGYYMYAWSHTNIGEPSDMFVYNKLHTRGYKWIYPVHEILTAIPEEVPEEHIIDFGKQIFLHHWPDKTKERHYYFDLLKLSVEENPSNCHVQLLYAREYLLNNDQNGALPEYLKLLKMPEIDKPENRNILLEALGRVADIYCIQKNYDESIWYAQEFIKEDPTYREPYLLLANMYNDMHMYTLAEGVLQSMFKYTTRKYTWIERKFSWLGLPNDILSITQYNLGNLDGAIENCQLALKHEPNDINLLQRLNAFLGVKIEKLGKEMANSQKKN